MDSANATDVKVSRRLVQRRVGRRRVSKVLLSANVAVLNHNIRVLGEKLARARQGWDCWDRQGDRLIYRTLVIRVARGGWCESVGYLIWPSDDERLAKLVAEETGLRLETAFLAPWVKPPNRALGPPPAAEHGPIRCGSCPDRDTPTSSSPSP